MAGLVATAAVLALTLPGIAEHGLWSAAEAAVLDRARASLGEPLYGVVASPWLPEMVRSWAYAISDAQDWGLRVPGTVAVALLVGLTAGLASRPGRWFDSLVAPAFAMALPLSTFAASLAVGRPLGELLLSLCIVLGYAGLRTPRKRPRILFTALALPCLAGSVACLGLVIGAGLPALTLAIAALRLSVPGVAKAWGAVGLGALVLGGYLVSGQGNGFIPLLAASRDLGLLDNPQGRPMGTIFDDATAQLFPWLALALVGLLRPGEHSLAAIWFVLGVTLTGLWSHVYGPTPLPVTLPAALLCSQAVRTLQHAETPAVLRRVGVLVAIAGLLVAAKDAQLLPHHFGSPLAPFAAQDYPVEAIASASYLSGVAQRGAAALLVAYLLWHVTWPRIRAAPAGEIRRLAGQAGIFLALLAQVWSFTTDFLPASTARLSPKGTMARYLEHAQHARLPTQLAAYRVSDAALERYVLAPLTHTTLKTRRELLRWLGAAELKTALIPEDELAAVHQSHRSKGRPFFVVDPIHPGLVVVSNTAIAGLDDTNPLLAVVADEDPKLSHPTWVRFGDVLEVVGWELQGPIHRGQEVRLTVALHVLRRVPQALTIYTRLYRGKLSRINAVAHKPTGGVYPPQYWRKGDYIIDRFDFKVPPLEIVSGEHELIVGLSKTKRERYKVTLPPEQASEDPSSGPSPGRGADLGLDKPRPYGKKGEYAVLGRIMVY